MKHVVREEVRAALDAGRPVVALESTVIAHGLPRPLNLETALRCESAVREAGAVAATIAVADGAAVIGADHALLARLANDDGVANVSLRDLAPVVARGGLSTSEDGERSQTNRWSGGQVVIRESCE